MNGTRKWIRALRQYSLPVGLGLFNLFLAGLWLVVLAPQLDALDLEKRQLRASNINLRNKVEANTMALETIDENRLRFAGLRQRGFIDRQDRLGATKLLERLRETHGLTSIYYEIAPETLYDDQATRATGFNIISTRITVRMHGLFDADLLEFAQAIVDEFPGQVRTLSFSLLKINTPTAAILSALRKGELVNFVSGELTFEWNTLLPIVKKTSG